MLSGFLSIGLLGSTGDSGKTVWHATPGLLRSASRSGPRCPLFALLSIFVYLNFWPGFH